MITTRIDKPTPAGQEITDTNHDSRRQRQLLAGTKQAQEDLLKLRNHDDHDHGDRDDGQQDHGGRIDHRRDHVAL